MQIRHGPLAVGAMALGILAATAVLCGCDTLGRPVTTITRVAVSATGTRTPRAAPTPSATPAPSRTQPRTPAPAASPPPTSVPRATYCLATVTPQPTTDSRPLRVLYADEDRLWLWREETDTAEALPLTGVAYDAVLSPDRRRIAFSRPLEDGRDEIWVVGVDGTGERRLAVADRWEFIARPSSTPPAPREGLAWLDLQWMGDSQTVAYGYRSHLTWLGPDDCAVGPVRLMDASSGTPRLVVPKDDLWGLAFAPDGGQIAALTSTELRLISPVDGGRVLATVPMQIEIWRRTYSLRYSPDSRHILAFAERALIVVDTADGRMQSIPLDYEPIGYGEYIGLPVLRWIETGTTLFATTSHGSSAIDLTAPDAAFDLWRIDIAHGTATRLYTFAGNGQSARMSPDGRWLAYQRRVGSSLRELYLADAQTGNHVLYDPQYALSPLEWSVDSSHLVCRTEGSWVMVARLCGEPIRIVDPLSGRAANCDSWLSIANTGRFLTIGSQSQNNSGGQPTGSLLSLNSVSGQARTIAELKGGNGGRWFDYFFDD